MCYTLDMSKLKDKKCLPCEGDVNPLSVKDIHTYMAEVSGWTLSKNNKSISQEFIFKNFDKAMDFVNVVADYAELEGHHPDIMISYNKVLLTLTTHSIKGLSENDFILAAKINSIHL